MKNTAVLIVEDEILLGMSLKSHLEKFGYKVTNVASSGREAVGEFLSNKPEIILMDIHLQGEMDGIETARVAMEEHGIPVIYLTGFSDDGLLNMAMKSNPFGFLMKPFAPQEVHASIQIALNRKEHIRFSEKRKNLSDEYYYTQFVNNTSKNFIKIEEYADSIGYEKEEILCMGSLSIPLLVCHADLDNLTKFMDNVISSNGEIVQTEFRLKHKSGNWKWFLNRSMIDYSETGDKQIISIVKDITHLKELERTAIVAQNKYLALHNNPYQGIAVLDSQGNIVEMNSALERLSGYTKDELNEINRTTYISKTDLQKICPAIDLIRSGKIATFQMEVRIFTKQAGSTWVYMVFSPVPCEEIKCKYIVCNVTDISEMKLLERNDLSTYWRR